MNGKVGDADVPPGFRGGYYESREIGHHLAGPACEGTQDMGDLAISMIAERTEAFGIHTARRALIHLPPCRIVNRVSADISLIK